MSARHETSPPWELKPFCSLEYFLGQSGTGFYIHVHIPSGIKIDLPARFRDPRSLSRFFVVPGYDMVWTLAIS